MLPGACAECLWVWCPVILSLAKSKTAHQRVGWSEPGFFLLCITPQVYWLFLLCWHVLAVTYTALANWAKFSLWPCMHAEYQSYRKGTVPGMQLYARE